VICFAFCSLILSASYTANLAAVLTTQRTTAIRSVYDLTGLAVSSIDTYIPYLKSQYGIIASDSNVGNVEGVVKEADLVAKGSLAAFMYDNVVSEYVAASFPGCAVSVLPDKVLPFDYGVAFKKGTDPELVSNISTAILTIQEQGIISQYADRFLLKNSPCSGANADTNSNQISFESVYGLWVIMGAGLVVGMIIMLFVRRRRFTAWEAHKKEMAGLPNGVAPDKEEKHSGFVEKGSDLECKLSKILNTLERDAETTNS